MTCTCGHHAESLVSHRQVEQIEQLVAEFFRSHALRILAQSHADVNSPSAVKQAMLEHYEHIFTAFADEMPYAFMHITYPNAAEAEAELKRTFAGKQPSPVDLLQFSCRDAHAHSHMIAAYRHCFATLLEGYLP
ncbi:MAG: hypothetical protein IJ196_04410 [Prevotella sp.]|nr:hypothetical protein [Prevotella sp.]